MSELSIILREYTGQGVAVQVPFTEEAWVNATALAKPFGKMVKDWLKTDQTRDYIAKLARKLFMEDPPVREANDPPFDPRLVIVMPQSAGRRPEEQGTWIHRKLVIFFARWLSAELAIWCDEQIEGILSTRHAVVVAPERDESFHAGLANYGEMLAQSNQILIQNSQMLAQNNQTNRNVEMLVQIMAGMHPTLCNVDKTTTETNERTVAIYSQGESILRDTGRIAEATVKANGGRGRYSNAERLLAAAVTKRHNECKCWNCDITVIVSPVTGLPIDGAFEMDHARDREDSSGEKGWPVCDSCNSKLGRPTSTPIRREAEAFFLMYQRKRKAFLSEQASDRKAAKLKEIEAEHGAFLGDEFK